MRHTAADRPPVLAVALCLLCVFAGIACDPIERAPDTQRPTRIGRENFTLEVEPIMRGTVSSEAVLVGYEEVVVRSYGLVVGLKGTGTRLVPAEVRAQMLSEMALRGVGDPRTEWGDVTPEAVLDSMDTAVVVVEGVIPPGATEGYRFDVRIYAAPGTQTTSLEGGRLFTTELRPGPLTVGSRRASALARARGSIFINPFVDPQAIGGDSVNRLSGRILNGGIVTSNMPVKLRLATTSHARAAEIQSAVNGQFPREPGQRQETARGESGDSIVVTVPPSYRERTPTFMKLLEHTTLRMGATEAVASSVRRGLLANPAAAEAASWRWRALGKKAIPMLHDLYDYPEEQPRLAALTAGARLDDQTVVSHLFDLVDTSTVMDRRLSAIGLLGSMGPNPRISVGLRQLLDHEELDIRLAAFDALVERRDLVMDDVPVGDKFMVTRVDSEYPLVYITQTGTPRIALFGSDLEIRRPMTLTMWDGRLIMKADSGADEIEVFFRPSDESRATVLLAPADQLELIRFLGRRTSPTNPEPGLDLTYGEVIGVLQRLSIQGYLDGDFKAEQDRLLASILRNETEEERMPRPEFDTDEMLEPDPAGVTQGSDLDGIIPDRATDWDSPRGSGGRDPGGRGTVPR